MITAFQPDIQIFFINIFVNISSSYFSHKVYDHSFQPDIQIYPEIYEDRRSGSSAEAKRQAPSKSVPYPDRIYDQRQLHSYAEVSRDDYLNQVPAHLLFHSSHMLKQLPNRTVDLILVADKILCQRY